MRPIILTVTLVLAAMCVASESSAQPRRARVRPVPDTGMVAIGGSIGASVPTDESFKNGLEIAGTIERYLTPRLSIRGQVAGTWWDITGRGFTGTTKPVIFDGNVVYNWEGGAIHPYVTGGVGLYHYGFDFAPVTGSANRAGIDLGGGVEFFTTRHVTFTFEGLYHAVSSPVQSPLASFESRFWTFSVGLKKYL